MKVIGEVSQCPRFESSMSVVLGKPLRHCLLREADDYALGLVWHFLLIWVVALGLDPAEGRSCSATISALPRSSKHTLISSWAIEDIKRQATWCTSIVSLNTSHPSPSSIVTRAIPNQPHPETHYKMFGLQAGITIAIMTTTVVAAQSASNFSTFLPPTAEPFIHIDLLVGLPANTTMPLGILGRAPNAGGASPPSIMSC